MENKQPEIKDKLLDNEEPIKIIKTRHCKICQSSDFETLTKGSRKVNICFNCKEIKEPKMCLGCEQTFMIYSYRVLLGWVFCSNCVQSRKSFKTVYSHKYDIASKMSDIKRLPKLKKYIDDVEKLIHEQHEITKKLEEMNKLFLKGQVMDRHGHPLSIQEKKLVEYQLEFNSNGKRPLVNEKEDKIENNKKQKVSNAEGLMNLKSPSKKTVSFQVKPKPKQIRPNNRTELSKNDIAEIKRLRSNGITRGKICETFHIGSRRFNDIINNTDDEQED